MADEKKQLYIVSHIDEQEGRKAYFERVGIAFKNKDGSFNIRLKRVSLDPNAQYHLAPYVPREKKDNDSFTE